MEFENIKNMIEYPKSGILSKTISKSEKIDVTLFCMGQNTEIGNHTTTKEGFVYVVEGEGMFNLEGKEIKMLPGVFINLKKSALHSLKSNKTCSFILTLVG